MSEEVRTRILIQTAADTSGAEKAAQAFEKVKEAADTNGEGFAPPEWDKSALAAREAAEAAEAADELAEKTKAAAKAAADAGNPWVTAAKNWENLTDEGAGVIRVSEDAAEKILGASRSAEAVASESMAASIGLRGLAVGAGGAAAAAALLRAGFDAWLEKNPELQASFSNLTEQIGEVATSALASWFETWIMSAETGKTVLDSLTIALGGQTEEMRKAAEPLQGYQTEAELAAERSREFAESLEAEAEAARKAGQALEHELEMLKARNALAGAKDESAYNQKIREIEASDMPADEKARAKAAAKAAREEQDFQRREEERAKQGDVLRGKADALERDARAKQQAAQEAARRRAEVQTREGLDTSVIPAREKAVRDAQEAWSSASAEGVMSPDEAARLQKEITAAQAALDKAKQERDAIAPGDANELDKNAREAEDAAKQAAKTAADAREAANRGQAKNRIDSATDRVSTKDRIDGIMWQGDEQAATANRQKKEREEREAKAQERAQKQRDEKAQKDREDREKAAALAAGNQAADHGDVTAASLRNQGLGDAAKTLESATSKLRDGATESEAAKVTQVLRELAPLIGQMGEQTRGQMAALKQEIEKLRSQIKNTRQ